MSDTPETVEISRLESSHIDAIDLGQRHGTPCDLFPVWFSGNLSIGNAIFGALAIVVGNSFWWAVVAVLVGNLVGGTFMALHSVQGARLGVPELIQSRGQFGFLGALLPVLLAAFLYAGFFVVTAVLGGQALSAAMPGTFSVNGGLVLLAVLSLVIALFGYRAIHVAARWAIWPLAAAVVVVTIASVLKGGIQASSGSFAAGPCFSAGGLMATFLLTCAPTFPTIRATCPRAARPAPASTGLSAASSSLRLGATSWAWCLLPRSVAPTCSCPLDGSSGSIGSQ